jgi:hypothetical protein
MKEKEAHKEPKEAPKEEPVSMEMKGKPPEKKVEAGAEFFQTQAVYDLDNFRRFMEFARKFPVKILAGIVLLTSARMATYMTENVPGIFVPQALIDELAHTNAPGSRHPKRYQDVEEILDAGIDVYTTLNIQHLESLNDVVAQITGVTVKETIPDRVIDEASEIELVDLPPQELLQRLKEGKVYSPEQAKQAMQDFFQRGNLVALRELTLTLVARKRAE